MVEIKLIVEPEKIKPVAFTLVVVIFGIGILKFTAATVLLMSNYAYFFINHDRMISNTYNYFNIGESGILIGISMFSFESINTVVNGKLSSASAQDDKTTATDDDLCAQHLHPSRFVLRGVRAFVPPGIRHGSDEKGCI